MEDRQLHALVEEGGIWTQEEHRTVHCQGGGEEGSVSCALLVARFDAGGGVFLSCCQDRNSLVGTEALALRAPLLTKSIIQLSYPFKSAIHLFFRHQLQAFTMSSYLPWYVCSGLFMDRASPAAASVFLPFLFNPHSGTGRHNGEGRVASRPSSVRRPSVGRVVGITVVSARKASTSRGSRGSDCHAHTGKLTAYISRPSPEGGSAVRHR